MLDNLLSESDIIHYLMTSDFNEGLTIEESKFLLLKYRSYYRIMHSKNEHLKDDLSLLTKRLQEREGELGKIEERHRIEKDEIESKLNAEKMRRLTLSERILGKKSN